MIIARAPVRISFGGFLLLYCSRRAQIMLRQTMHELGLIELPFDVGWMGAHRFQPAGLERLPLAANRMRVPGWNGREG